MDYVFPLHSVNVNVLVTVGYSDLRGLSLPCYSNLYIVNIS